LNAKISIVITALFLSACTIAPDGVSDFDPFEAQNREMHEFNKGFDTAIFGPIRGGVSNVSPELTQPVINFADNVGLPGMVLNGVLQADLEGALQNTLRFAVNSTIGVGGLFDPAIELRLAEAETDFGETLAVWGVPEGAYLELPLIGPSTERALAGRVVDSVLDPLKDVGLPAQIKYGSASRVLARVLKRIQFGETVDSILYDSADSYLQQRLIYLQNRRFELGTTVVEESVDPYADLYGE
jgi:phospholipid-binding lipoprotein MlaA